MAILSSVVRRSNLRRLLLSRSSGSTQQNANALLLRRGIHATSAVNGDALDMADTFSRRHGKFAFLGAHDVCITIIPSISASKKNEL
jgi:hypothetical protein